MSHWNTNWRCQTDNKNFDFIKRRHLENSQHFYAFRQPSPILKQSTFLESSHHTWSKKWEKSFQKQSLSFSQLSMSQSISWEGQKFHFCNWLIHEWPIEIQFEALKALEKILIYDAETIKKISAFKNRNFFPWSSTWKVTSYSDSATQKTI